MKNNKLSYYYRNCFVLLIPILVWNIIFTGYLPEDHSTYDYWRNTNLFILFGEIISGLIVVFMPLFMRVSLKRRSQKIGLVVYFIGLLIYLIAWRPLILYPDGDWAGSIFGFTSLAISPLILLIGIGLIGNKLVFRITYHQSKYIFISIIFVIFRTWHSILIYRQII